MARILDILDYELRLDGAFEVRSDEYGCHVTSTRSIATLATERLLGYQFSEWFPADKISEAMLLAVCLNYIEDVSGVVGVEPKDGRHGQV